MKTGLIFDFFGWMLAILSLFLPYKSQAANLLALSDNHSLAYVVFNNITVMFLVLLLWIVSPIGILFFLSAGSLLSGTSSNIKRKIAWVGQGMAFIGWISLMILFAVLYLDSVSFGVFRLGGEVLNVAILSGIAFGAVMFYVIIMEKSIGLPKKGRFKCCRDNMFQEKEKSGENKKSDSGKEEPAEEKEGNLKFSGFEFGGIKRKARKRIKEELKEIVDKEIDKRL